MMRRSSGPMRPKSASRQRQRPELARGDRRPGDVKSPALMSKLLVWVVNSGRSVGFVWAGSRRGRDVFRSVCPQWRIRIYNLQKKTTSCPVINDCRKGCSPISILKPEIVIEERRWYPYPLVIRHYIEKPAPERINIFKRWYRKCQAELRQREERRKERQKQLEEQERMERERCLKELRRLHSYHQSLCNRTQSLPAFSKDAHRICKTKRMRKVKWKSRSVSVKTEDKERSRRNDCRNEFSCFRICCDLVCCLSVLTVLGITIIIYIL